MHLLIAIIANALKPRGIDPDMGRVVIQAQSDGMTMLTTAKASRGPYGIQG